MLVLYHPNYWMQTRVLEPCHTRGVSTFNAMSWQVEFWPCLKLCLRRLRWRWHDIRRGNLLVFRHGGLKYEMTALYNKFDFAGHADITAVVLDAMKRILPRFERVIVVRTLLKQEMVPEEFQNDLLRSSLRNYDEGWEVFQKRLEELEPL